MKKKIGHLTEYQLEVLWANALALLVAGYTLTDDLWNQAVAVAERMDKES